MKNRPIIVCLCGATLLVLALTVAFLRPEHAPKAHGADERTFEVSGRVISLDPNTKTLRIAHEAVPEYMPAMTMPFAVADTSLLNGLAAGDQVQFQLVVTADDSWIARIQKLPGPVSGQAAAKPTPGDTEPARDLDRVQVGEKLPNFTLTDQDGRPLRLSDFAGQPVVLTFIYTRCPLPNFCPLMSKNFAQLQERMLKNSGTKYHLLSVTIDPEFDRPEILRTYSERYGANPEHWTFATGTHDQTDAVANLLGLTHEPENGFISHDLRTALISPEGRLWQVWKSNVWTPYEIERAVRESLSPGAPGLARR